MEVAQSSSKDHVAGIADEDDGGVTSMFLSIGTAPAAARQSAAEAYIANQQAMRQAAASEQAAEASRAEEASGKKQEQQLQQRRLQLGRVRSRVMPKPNKLNSRQQLRWQQQEIVGGKESEAAKIQHEEQEAERRAQESQARSQQAVQRAHHTEMLYTYVLYVVLSIVVVFLCIARSQIKSKHVGSLQEPLLKDVDLEKDEQSEPPLRQQRLPWLLLRSRRRRLWRVQPRQRRTWNPQGTMRQEKGPMLFRMAGSYP